MIIFLNPPQTNGVDEGGRVDGRCEEVGICEWVQKSAGTFDTRLTQRSVHFDISLISVSNISSLICLIGLIVVSKHIKEYQSHIKISKNGLIQEC